MRCGAVFRSASDDAVKLSGLRADEVMKDKKDRMMPTVAVDPVLACHDAGNYRLLDQVAMPVFVLERCPTRRAVYAAYNLTACEIAGFRPEDVVGRTAKELYGGRFGQVAYDRHCVAMESGCPMVYELTLPLSGSNRQVRTSLEPVFDDDGQTLRLVGTSQDISAAANIDHLKTHAATLHSEIEEFVSLAAHDLRSPMRKVGALANLIRDEISPDNAEAGELIDMLEGVAGNAMSLIADVLSYAQATGSAESVEKFDLEALCESLMVVLDPEGRHRYEVPDQYIFGDRLATQIVLRNLLDNAIKHNPDCRLTLRVSVETVDASSYAISLSDDGKGLPDAGTLFEDSGRLKIDSGYGLAGARRLVRSRGGDIAADPHPVDGGATIRFSLPGTLLPGP